MTTAVVSPENQVYLNVYTTMSHNVTRVKRKKKPVRNESSSLRVGYFCQPHRYGAYRVGRRHVRRWLKLIVKTNIRIKII